MNWKTIILLSWPFYLNDLYLILLDQSNLTLLWLLDIVFFTSIPTVTLIILIRNKKINLDKIGLRSGFNIKNILLGILLFFFMVIFMNWNLSIWIKDNFPGGLFNGYSFPAETTLFWITVVYAALSSGILEEIIFRGVLITELEKSLKSTLMLVLFACLFFALIHWSQGISKIIRTFIIAIIPTYWFIKSRQIFGNTVFHVLYNFLIFSGYV